MKMLLFTLIYSSIVFGNTNERNVTISTSKIQPISSDIIESIQYLRKRNPTSFSRPASCPLQISKHLNILTKLESIKILFKNTCFSDFEEQFTAILDGARDLEASLGETSNIGTDETVTSLKDLENSEKVAKIFNGLSDIYSKNKCVVQSERILVTIADIISDVSRFGALASNKTGNLVFAGGAGASATLLLLNEVLKRGFKFQDKNYRRSFIKLNCAFYDVRNDMEAKGLFTIKTKDHEKQLAATKRVEKKLKELHKTNVLYVNDSIKKIELEKLIFQKSSFPEEVELLEKLVMAEKILTKEIVELPTNPHEMQKLQLIFDLSKIAENIELKLKVLRKKEGKPLSSMDLMYIEDLSHFNELKHPEKYKTILKLSLKKLKKHIGARLNFNNARVKGSIEKMLSVEVKEWEKRNDIKNIIKRLKESLKKQTEEINQYLQIIGLIKIKLKNILSIKDFTSKDDGRGAIVDILDEFNIILSKIYGKIGNSFMSFTLKKGDKYLESFNEKFTSFSSRHLYRGSIKDPLKISHSERVAACQDARPFRRIFHFGHSLIEQGYDFIETNADLFHGDKLSLYMKDPSHKRSLLFMTRWSKLRRHYKSAYYANRIIKKLSVEGLDEKVLSRRSLGELMLKSYSAKKKAETLQSLIENYDCLNISNDF